MTGVSSPPKIHGGIYRPLLLSLHLAAPQKTPEMLPSCRVLFGGPGSDFFCRENPWDFLELLKVVSVKIKQQQQPTTNNQQQQHQQRQQQRQQRQQQQQQQQQQQRDSMTYWIWLFQEFWLYGLHKRIFLLTKGHPKYQLFVIMPRLRFFYTHFNVYTQKLDWEGAFADMCPLNYPNVDK